MKSEILETVEVTWLPGATQVAYETLLDGSKVYCVTDGYTKIDCTSEEAAEQLYRAIVFGSV